ncbi:MAG TPA: hypothetical protein DCL13_05520 [Peptococcaceae bacterium]|nr:hypothetical protein [Peptococcaceae bacterium]
MAHRVAERDKRAGGDVPRPLIFIRGGCSTGVIPFQVFFRSLVVRNRLLRGGRQPGARLLSAY